MGAENIFRGCMLEHKRPRILAESHEGITGGHYVGKATAQDYGGQLFFEMQRNIVNNAMFFRGLANQIDGMRFPYIHK
jgi:hypothetical protein